MDQQALAEAQRLAAMQGQGAAGQQQEAQKKERERMKQQEEQKKALVQAILTAEARERLERIKLVRPDKARGVEELLIQGVQRGQIQGRVDEPQLKDLLAQISGESTAKVVVKRRIAAFDSDEDNYDDI